MRVLPCIVKGSASSRHSIACSLQEDARSVSLYVLDPSGDHDGFWFVRCSDMYPSKQIGSI